MSMPLPQEIIGATERDLLEQAAAGSTEALSTLFEQYSALVHRVAFRLTLSADDAEDVVQDVFVGLPEALATFSRAGDFAAWLRRVAVRTTLMRLRSASRRTATATRASQSQPASRADDTLDRLAIIAALSQLPSELREVFVLSDIEGYAHGEIAKMLGIRTGTSEVRLHRARRRLRALLGDE
jgi:RNA polymerase sigma-70 factor, ECF subfamily